MKNTLLILFFTLIALTGCDQREHPTQVNKSDCEGMLNVQQWRKEALDRDSIMINDEIPLLSTKADIIRLLGKPDQIIKISQKEGNIPYLIKNTSSTASRWIYGGTILDEVEGKIMVNTIDFESTDVKLVHPKLVLKKGLSAREICQLFPESCKLIIVNGNAWAGHIELKSSHYDGDPRMWFLIFRAGGLAKVILYPFSFQ